MRELKAKYQGTGRMLPILAAERFLEGHVTAPDNLPLQEFMFHVVKHLVRDGAPVTDETCASLALSEARVVGARRARFDKDGFGRGIKRAKPSRLMETLAQIDRILLQTMGFH
jgi:hypothetical protein